MSNPKSTTAEDRAVGERVTALRKAAGLSQTALGLHVGVTFQQVQKYERGQNRIGVGRLVAIAKALGVTVATLVGQDGEAAPESDVTRLLAEPGAADLLRAFAAIPAGERRAALIRTARALGGPGQAEAA